MSIDKLLDELIAREGGYVNHPNDRGGPTKYGITQHVARAYGFRDDMSALPLKTAKDIYLRQYWTDPGFGKVNVLMPKVAEELFDTGVNMGPRTAAKMLQRALNTLNRGTLDYPDLGVDGALGRMSIYALEHFKTKRGAQAEAVLLRLLNALQAVRYVEIAEGSKTQEDFMFGWIANRVV